MDVKYHLYEDQPPEEQIVNSRGKEIPNPQFNSWVNNDELLTSWMLDTIMEEVLSMIEKSDT